MLTYAETEEKTIKLQKRLKSLLKMGCFNMRKWTSNNQMVMEQIPEEYQGTTYQLSINSANTVKILNLE